jgi:hypothetical protein
MAGTNSVKATEGKGAGMSPFQTIRIGYDRLQKLCSGPPISGTE